MRREAAQSFAASWMRRDPGGMWLMLDKRSRSAYPRARFARLVRSAESQATVKSVRVGRLAQERDGRFDLPTVMPTRIFGTLRGTIALSVHDEDGAARVAWAPHQRLPGLRPGEQVRRIVLTRPTRAQIVGAGGRLLSASPATAALAGRPPSGNDRGTGLERLYDERLAGTPGEQLRFGDRVVATVKRHRGHSVHATIRPGLQRAAAAALGGKLGGVAVVRPRDGSVLALAGLAVSAPQPPARRSRSSRCPARWRPASRRRRAPSRCARPRRSRASRCATPAAIVRRHADAGLHRLVQLGLRAARSQARGQAPGDDGRGLRVQRATAGPDAKPSTIPPAAKLTDSLAVGASAIGQDRDLATPLQMAVVGATIAERGRRARPRIVRNDKVLRRRVVSARVAGQVREMMLGVVRSGTGTAAAIPGVQVAGKTGTAELRPNSTNPRTPTRGSSPSRLPDKPQVARGGHARRGRLRRHVGRTDRAPRTAGRASLGPGNP